MPLDRRYLTAFPCAALVALAAACAAPTTRLAQVTPEEIDAEERRQREIVLEARHIEQQRLDAIAFPILTRAVALCGDAVRPRHGFDVSLLGDYTSEWQPAAQAVFELGDTLQVVRVTDSSPAYRAGLIPGDRVLMVNDVPIPTGKGARPAMMEALRTARELGPAPLRLRIARADRIETVEVVPEPGCAYPATVVQSDAINAYADGEQILVTTALMRFMDDNELRVIVSHELAHNAMGHIKAQRKNTLFGALLGVIADVALMRMGSNTGGYYTRQGAALGSRSFSQDFEREADYVGLYALAHTGVEIEDAPTVWRHFALVDPKAIGLAFTHPTTAERFVRLERTIEEIRDKAARGLALTPNLRRDDSRKKARASEAEVAAPEPGPVTAAVGGTGSGADVLHARDRRPTAPAAPAKAAVASPPPRDTLHLMPLDARMKFVHDSVKAEDARRRANRVCSEVDYLMGVCERPAATQPQ